MQVTNFGRRPGSATRIVDDGSLSRCGRFRLSGRKERLPPPRPPVPHSVNTARARGRASRRICTASDPPPPRGGPHARFGGTGRVRETRFRLSRENVWPPRHRARSHPWPPAATARILRRALPGSARARSRCCDERVVATRATTRGHRAQRRRHGAVLAGTSSASSVRGTDGASASSPRCTGSPRSSPCSRSSSRTSSSCSSSPARRETTRARTRRVPRTRAPPRSSRPRARGPRAWMSRSSSRTRSRRSSGCSPWASPPARTPTSATTTTAWTSWSCSRAGRW